METKKTIVALNSHNFQSTGNIMINIAKEAEKSGYNVITYSPAGRTQIKGIKNHRFIGSIFERRICDYINSLTGYQGSLLYIGTLKLILELNKIKPDIIHLHNLHSNYINLKMLFEYIKKNEIKVVWTLHDCWAFTGHCPYFDAVNCDKWKSGCYSCPLYNIDIATKIDRSKYMYKKKKELFTGVKDMIIVTPSQWLKALVQQSFLQNYHVCCINNGIELNKFKPRKSDFREKYNLQDKFIILGCASSWGKRKGLDRFESLAAKLTSEYQIVLVGIDKTSVNSDKIVCISRTKDQISLAELYSSADVFLNPTREDNFPTVNIEALACGTPVLTYGAGGSAEAIDEKSGMIVTDENVVDVLYNIKKKNFNSDDCIKRSKCFNYIDKYIEYIQIYNSFFEKGK